MVHSLQFVQFIKCTVHKTGPLLLPVRHPLTVLVTAEHLNCEQTCGAPNVNDCRTVSDLSFVSPIHLSYKVFVVSILLFIGLYPICIT